jgi:uncharacterized protein (TIGR02117 family)
VPAVEEHRIAGSTLFVRYEGLPVSKRWIRAGLSVAIAPLILGSLYLLAAVVCGLVAVNRDREPVPSGVDVYLLTNGIHTDVVVPIVTPEKDWHGVLPIRELRIIPGVLDDLAFGWGDREFYLTTPTLADLRLTTAVKALFGLDRSVIHVEAVARPDPEANTRHILLSAEGYRRLVGYLEAGFLRGDQGAPLLIPGAHYTLHDAFFEAEGHYSMAVTCNEWVRRALAEAGVRVPLWAPFGQALFYQIP